MEDAATGRGGDLLMVTMGKIADWLGVSAPLLNEEVAEVSNIEGATKRAVGFAEDGGEQ